MTKNNDSKIEVVNHISSGKLWHIASSEGPSKWRVGNYIVHVRFRSSPKADGHTFAYNINPNILSADYEVWICGNSYSYYLMPISIIEKIYNSPSAYIDKHHPEIRVVDINIKTHCALYGSGGKRMDFSSFFRASL